jgi:hypothetical protein
MPHDRLACSGTLPYAQIIHGLKTLSERVFSNYAKAADHDAPRFLASSLDKEGTERRTLACRDDGIHAIALANDPGME